MNPQTPTNPASFQRIYTLIYLAQLASVFIYGIVVMVVGIDEIGGSAGTLFFPFAGISIILAVSGLFLRSRILQVDAGIDYAEAQGKFSTMFLVIIALFEAIAIFGLVLALLGGGMKMYLNFAIPSLALLLCQYPLLGQLVEKLEEIHRRNPSDERERPKA